MPILTENGRLTADEDRFPVQVAHGIKTEDATAVTALDSPQTISSSVVEIKIPTDALVMVVRADGADLRVGDNGTLDGTGPGKGYFLVPNGTVQAFPCADKTSLQFLRDASTDVTMYFYFEMID